MSNNNNVREYGEDDMIRDFLNPSEYMSATDLSGKGNLTVKSVNQNESEEYGKSYAVTFDAEDGTTYLSYISAKQPYTVFDRYKTDIIGCVVCFDKTTTKDKKTILKMRMVKPTPEFKA